MLNTANAKSSQTINIPHDWDIFELGKLGNFSKGKGILKEQVKQDGFPCIRYGEIYTTHDFIIKEFRSFIDKNVAKKSQEIKKGDILFAGSGETIEEIGKAVAYKGNEKAYAGGDIIILSTDDEANAEYLAFVLETDFVRKQKRRLGQGQSVVHIYRSDLSKLKIPLPPQTERKKIAEILSTWDRAIETCEKLISAKQTRKRALMERLLTGKQRFSQFAGQAWKEVRLGDVTKKISRRNKNLIDARVYSVTNSTGFVLQSDHFSREVAGNDLSNYKIIKKDEFAYNPARINVGSIAFFKDEIGIISSLYVCFRTNEKILDAFLSQMLQLNYTKFKINAFGEGGVRVYLWYELFAKIKIEIPSVEEQAKIVEVLSACDKEIKLLENQRDALKHQKRGLMQKLLTGKVRVKVEELSKGKEV